MKYFKFFIAVIGVISILITGCLNPNSLENEKQRIDVLKRIGDEDKYEDFKKIIKDDQVQKVKEILEDIDWENREVDMPRFADYIFGFQFKNPGIRAKAVGYELWIGPNKDSVELVIDAENKYIQLDKDKSAELFEILTGENISDLK
jgi:hypothetical protein